MSGARHVIVVVALIVSACGEIADPDTAPPEPAVTPLAGSDPFVALARTSDDATSAQRRELLTSLGAPSAAGRVGGGEDFYLAIHRSVLSERWFLSAFMQQYFPGAVAGGSAYSLGTRVVSFWVQNDKLFVFDVDDRAASSSVFDPQRIVEAYPIVHDPLLDLLPGARSYVIIDPSAGLNRFDVVSDVFGEWYDTRFAVELVFLQAFERLADGVYWEQVFTGYAEEPLDEPFNDGDIDANQYRTAGTLGVSLRRYREGERYAEVALPTTEFYFGSDWRLVPDTGTRQQVAAHWDIHPARRPIEWVISPTLAAVDETPAFADVDLVGSVRRGVEQWNEAFGFPALSARVARPDESFSRDDVNYIIYDPDPSLGYAYANWRTNPNTGEIRGASIYVGSSWLDRSSFVASSALAAESAAPPRRRRTLRWGAVAGELLCAREMPARNELARDELARDELARDELARDELARDELARDELARDDLARDDLARLATSGTPAQDFESFIADLIAHEVGHTLGLRHNFKGSLLPPTSSVMDYARTVDSIASAGHPGSYDIAAIRYLYGLAPSLPTQPFCVDDQVGIDPDCQKYDRGADPLVVQWIPYYRSVRDWYLEGETDTWYLDRWATALIDYALRAQAERASRALDALLDGVGVPVDPYTGSDPVAAAGADLVLRWVLTKLAPAAGAAAVPLPGAVDARVDAQLEAVLGNADGIRTALTRRVIVDLLARRQTLASYAILLRGRDRVAAELAAAEPGGPEALLARDLLARIDAATDPYFE